MSGRTTRRNQPRSKEQLRETIKARKLLLTQETPKKGASDFLARKNTASRELPHNIDEWRDRFPNDSEPEPNAAAAAPKPEKQEPPAGPPYIIPTCPRGKLQKGPNAACDGWYVVPEERAAVWSTAFPDMPTCWTDRNKAPIADNLIRDYLQCIMRIDELRQAALDFTYARYGINPKTMSGTELSKLLENTEIIKTDTTLSGYLEDVEFLISFPQPNMQTLLKDTKEKLLREQPLLNMIYPWRLSNLQIKLLADNFAYLKKDPADIDRLIALYAREDKKAYQTALEITAGHLMSDAYELSYKLTGGEPIDGHFMYQNVETFKKTFKTFYSTFLQAIVEKKNVFDPETCKNLFYAACVDYTTTSARAAAAIFLLYKQSDTWTHTLLLEQFKDPAGKRCDTPLKFQLEESIPYLPLKEAWSSVVVEGLTFGSLVNQMNPNLMQFVLQLAYRLEKPEAGGPTKPPETAA